MIVKCVKYGSAHVSQNVKHEEKLENADVMFNKM